MYTGQGVFSSRRATLAPLVRQWRARVMPRVHLSSKKRCPVYIYLSQSQKKKRAKAHAFFWGFSPLVTFSSWHMVLEHLFCVVFCVACVLCNSRGGVCPMRFFPHCGVILCVFTHLSSHKFARPIFQGRVATLAIIAWVLALLSPRKVG